MDRLALTCVSFNGLEFKIGSKAKNMDAMVPFTGKISRRAKNEAVTAVKASDIAVFIQTGVIPIPNQG